MNSKCDDRTYLGHVECIGKLMHAYTCGWPIFIKTTIQLLRIIYIAKTLNYNILQILFLFMGLNGISNNSLSKIQQFLMYEVCQHRCCNKEIVVIDLVVLNCFMSHLSFRFKLPKTHSSLIQYPPYILLYFIRIIILGDLRSSERLEIFTHKYI